jgi:hypothetical protein
MHTMRLCCFGLAIEHASASCVFDISTLMLQLPEPDLIAQAAGHLNRAHYASQLGLNPEEWPEFREMALMLWPMLLSSLRW